MVFMDQDLEFLLIKYMLRNDFTILIHSLTNYNNILDNSNYKGNNTEDTFIINYNDGTQRGNGVLNNNNVLK